MNTVSIHDAKSNLSKYIEAAKKGERIYIGGFGKPEVVLAKIPTDESNLIGKNNFSIAIGKIKEKPDSFSSPTEDQISDLLYGK